MEQPSQEPLPQAPITGQPEAPEPSFLSHFPKLFPALFFTLAIFNSILWSFAIILAYRNHASPIYTMLQIGLPSNDQSKSSLTHQIFPKFILPSPTVMPSPTPTPFLPQLISKIDLNPTPTPQPKADRPLPDTTQPTPTPTIFFVSHDDIIEGNAYTMPPGACTKPLTYRIDSMDDRFGLSREQFSRDAKQAADIWNTRTNKTLFEENSSGTIHINLVYDDRQPLVVKLNEFQQKLMTDSAKITSEKTSFDTKKNTYSQNIIQYNEANSPGYTGPLSLSDIQKLYNDLVQLKAALELLVTTINTDVASYNAEVTEFNATKAKLLELTAKTSYAGLYNVNSQTIYIFLYNTPEDLIHTIAHELGHAIGLGHNSNIASIMYTDTNPTIQLSTEDIAAIVTRCSL